MFWSDHGKIESDLITVGVIILIVIAGALKIAGLIP
jgi:hypothetical protein